MPTGLLRIASDAWVAHAAGRTEPVGIYAGPSLGDELPRTSTASLSEA